MKGVFQTAFEAAYIKGAKSDSDVNEAVAELYTMACAIDGARSRLVDAAADAARDLARLSGRIEDGYREMSNPCASSRIYDLPQLVTALDMQIDAFWKMLRVHAGQAAKEALRATIVDGFKLATAERVKS